MRLTIITEAFVFISYFPARSSLQKLLTKALNERSQQKGLTNVLNN